MSPVENRARRRETRSLLVVLVGISGLILGRYMGLEGVALNRVLGWLAVFLTLSTVLYNLRPGDNFSALDSALKRRNVSDDFEYLFKLVLGVALVFGLLGSYMGFAVVRAIMGLALPFSQRRMLGGQYLLVTGLPVFGIVVGRAVAAMRLLARAYRAI